MADVRSMLRQERSARKITHPLASYGTTGKLECKTCRVPVKAEGGAWDNHLRSTQHAMRTERARLNDINTEEENERRDGKISGQNQAPEDSHRSIKKRKVDAPEAHDIKKKARGVVSFMGELEDSDTQSHPGQSATNHHTAKDESPHLQTQPTDANLKVPPHDQHTTVEADKPVPTVDEDEWAAFERDVAEPVPSKIPSQTKTRGTNASSIMAAASISAAPISTAELNAASTTEESRAEQAKRREAETIAEEEDAARALEDEFAEMEELESKVKRLKEQREALRRQQLPQAQINTQDPVNIETTTAAIIEEESDLDEDDKWKFGQ